MSDKGGQIRRHGHASTESGQYGQKKTQCACRWQKGYFKKQGRANMKTPRQRRNGRAQRGATVKSEVGSNLEGAVLDARRRRLRLAR